MSWNDERVELLKKLWAEGLSASQIANRMGGELSRNAVIGKVSRIGLPPRQTRLRQSIGGTHGAKIARAKMREAAAAKRGKSAKPLSAIKRIFAAEPFEPRPVLEVPAGQRKVLDQLNPGDCRFPYGDGPFTFCGRPKVHGISYCSDHAKVCYQPPTPVRRPGTPARSLPVVADNDSGAEGRGQTPANESATSGLRKAKETV